MTNGEKHIEKILSWYKEAVTEGGVCYLTSDDQNTLAYAIECCKHFEDIKKNIDSWALREEPSSSGKPNKSEISTGSNTNNLALIHTEGLDEEIRCTMCTNYMKSDRGCDGSCVVNKDMYKAVIDAIEKRILPTTKNDLGVDNQNIRLIDANALIKRLRPKHFDWWGEGEQDDFGKGNNSMLEEVIEAIEEFPSVTPIRPKGHWIAVYQGDEIINYRCSECEFGNTFGKGTIGMNFCSHCGADMRTSED
jgi:hypothetical protein